jgi:hypothetical protein
VCARCGCARPHKVLHSGKVQTYCRECWPKYTKAHYEANKKLHNGRRVENGRRHRAFIQSKIDELKQGKPCMDCGNIYPTYVMEF